MIVNTMLQCAGDLFAATRLKCGFSFPHLLSFPWLKAFAGGVTLLCGMGYCS